MMEHSTLSAVDHSTNKWRTIPPLYGGLFHCLQLVVWLHSIKRQNGHLIRFPCVGLRSLALPFPAIQTSLVYDQLSSTLGGRCNHIGVGRSEQRLLGDLERLHINVQSTKPALLAMKHPLKRSVARFPLDHEKRWIELAIIKNSEALHALVVLLEQDRRTFQEMNKAKNNAFRYEINLSQ